MPDIKETQSALAAIISDSYLKELSAANEIEVIISDNSEPVFTADDIFAACKPLTRLLRYIFVMHNVTKGSFMSKAIMYGKNMDYDPSKMASMKTNLIKNVIGDSITMTKFEENICRYLGLDLLDMKVVLRDRRTRNIYEHTLSDIDEFYSSIEKSTANRVNDLSAYADDYPE